MSHEIETMFYTDWETPWHGLGTPINEAPAGADALKLAGLDWTVGLGPLYTNGPIGLPVEVPGWKAIARETDGAVLGMSRGGAYTPFQNEAAFDFLEALVGTGDLRYDTAGALFGGKRIWALARTPEAITIGEGDKVWPYLLLVNGHDAHTALQVLPTTTRVVCNCTLNAALGRSDAAINVRIYHTGSLPARVAEAQRVLGIATVEFAAFKRMGDEMQARDGLPYVDKLLNKLFPPPKKGAKAVSIAAYDFTDAQRRMAIKRDDGTAWGLLNGITAWVDHRDRRSKDDGNATSRLMDNVLFGSGAALKAQAATSLMQMAKIYQDIMREREESMVAVRAKANAAAAIV